MNCPICGSEAVEASGRCAACGAVWDVREGSRVWLGNVRLRARGLAGRLAGKPVLMLPVFVEQMMTLHRVATQGLGHGIDPASDVAAIDAAVRRLADDAACRLRAVNFARAYDRYRPQIAIDAVADEIGELVSG